MRRRAIAPASMVLAPFVLVACALAAPAPAPTADGGRESQTTAPPSVAAGPSAAPPPTPNATLAPWGPFPRTGLQARPEPDPLLTPGVADPAVTPANVAATICVPGYTATVRPPASFTTALKVRQIAEYGYTDPATADYEEDHLVSLELGGAPRDPANLWPEPYVAPLPDGTPAGAGVKDRLEDWLHGHVCSGALSLAEAQREEATDWVTAWYRAGRP